LNLEGESDDELVQLAHRVTGCWLFVFTIPPAAAGPRIPGVLSMVRTPLMLMLTAILMTLLVGGCGRASRNMAVPVVGLPAQPEYATLVEVDNFRGNVRVIVDPSKPPAVWAKPRRVGPNAPRRAAELAELVQVDAVSSIEEGQRMLKVVTAPTSDPRDVAVDLTVRIARSAGTAVRNSGGRVDLVHISGPVHVENGIAGQDGGDVQIRTGSAMVAPAYVRTTTGSVLYQVGEGSTGDFDLKSEEGRAVFSSRLGRVSQVSSGRDWWRGVLDGGPNEVVLRGEKLVRAAVMRNAGTYGPEIWDGYPSERFMARLRGE
jgi:hypothetical protein